MGDIVRRGSAWYVRYKDTDGTRRMRASHQPSRELARRFLVEIEARVARGLIGIAAPAPPSPTVAEAVTRFLAEYSRPKIKDLEHYRVHARKNLRRVLPRLGDRRLDQVSSADVAAMRDVIARRYAAASVKVTLSFLATLFSWAHKKGLVPSNPLRGVERPTPQGSVDFFTKEEVWALLRTAAERATTGTALDRLRYAAVFLTAHCGIRKGELLGLRWCDLDLGTRRLTIARSYHTTPKSNQTRHLRLPTLCVPVLQKWKSVCPATPEGLVFPIAGSGARPERSMLGLPGLLRAASCRIPEHPWQAMRHTFASHFIMAGGNILTLQKILGHSDVKMTMIYAHLAPDFLGDELDRLTYSPKVPA